MKQILLFISIILLSSTLSANSTSAEKTSQNQAHSQATADDHDEHESEEDHHDEHDEEGHVELTAEQIQAADIGLEQVGPALIRETLPLYGVIVPNAEHIQHVTARFPGVILRLNKQVGDSVRQGEVLAVIESNENLETFSVKSRFSGVITERGVHVGEPASDRVLFVVADLTTVWVEVLLFPHDMDRVRVGQSVYINHTKMNLNAEGKVIHITPFSNRLNQTLTARVLLNNPERYWKPGLFVNAKVTLAETSVPIAVRSEAVQTLESHSIVFIQGDEGFEPRPVTLGRSDGDMSEVLNGLEVGETYVGRNSFILKSELGKEDTEHGH